ncbi:MAG TPA: 23S rRNA (adenine(2030)-N(6))-methyltransferase RlmJ, partial [Nevskiaceae bacterium]
MAGVDVGRVEGILMHYLHLYHAGNFADVFKHVLLIALLEALSMKDTPWCFIDTHAGAGIYGLDEASTPEAAEWRQGIGRLWRAGPRSALLGRYLATLREVAGAGEAPRGYPGSPWWGVRMARPHDRVIACEQQAEIAKLLRRTVPRAEVQRRDGYGLLGALPPRERRGLVLVDPPFERADEFDAARAFI